jgi:hypothetical protein
MSWLGRDDWSATRTGHFTPGSEHGNHWIWGSLEPRVVLGGLRKQKISFRTRNSNPRPITPYLLAIGVCVCACVRVVCILSCFAFNFLVVAVASCRYWWCFYMCNSAAHFANGELHTLNSGALIEVCIMDLYIKTVDRISVHNKLHNPAIPLKPEETSFVPNRTFCVYTFTITTMYIPLDE